MNDINEIRERIRAFIHFRDLNPDKSYTSAEAADAIALADELDRLNAQALELCAELSRLRRENERLRGLLREARPIAASVVAVTQDASKYLRPDAPINMARAAAAHDALTDWIARIDAALAGEPATEPAKTADQPSAATENPEAMYNPVARESHAGASARQIDVAAGAPPSACNHFPGQSTCEWCGAVQPERCCVDYPRCDCNSPPEPDNEWPTREEAEKRAAELMAIGLYNELLYAVASKYPGESRHDTALRYIRDRETRPSNGPSQAVEPKQ